MMIKRVGFVHTVGFLVDTFRGAMRAELPEIDCFHSLNESLLQDLLRGVSKAAVYRRVVEQIGLVADAGADLIVVTCSSTSPAVDVARQVIEVPILKIDDPMATAAVQSGSRIALICTATSTVEPSSRLLKSHARELGRDIAITPWIEPTAYDALMKGDRARHDAIVLDAARRAASGADVLVLAQASLAHLAAELSGNLTVPVLSSPPLLMREIAKRSC
jgi:Asp/Glu/hydantoin racemase